MSKPNLALAFVCLATSLSLKFGFADAEQPFQEPDRPTGSVAVQTDVVSNVEVPGSQSGAVLLRTVDPRRIVEIENPVYEPDPELGVRTGGPVVCENIAYNNRPPSRMALS